MKKCKNTYQFCLLLFFNWIESYFTYGCFFRPPQGCSFRRKCGVQSYTTSHQRTI